MSLLQEATFERLLPRYERAFGGPPPFRSASLDEVIAHMRERLRAAGDAAAGGTSTTMRMGAMPHPGIPPAESACHPVH